MSGTARPPASSPPASKPAAGHEHEQAGRHRAGADERRGQRRGNAADEQVLDGVHVTDQPGQQIAGPECSQPGGGQPLEPAVNRDPHIAQHPEGDVVRAEPLTVPEDAAADAEGAHRDDGARDRENAWVLRRPGEQEAGGREQGDGAPGRGCSGGYGQRHPAA